jgi:hypothetical protein
MLAGMMAHSGLDLGSRPHPPNQWNPLGFFEDQGTTSLNERILAPYVGQINQSGEFDRHLQEGEAWLARFPLGFVPEVDGDVDSLVSTEVSGRPFYRKDPRFCFTLPVWRRHLDPNALFLCIFRDPVRSALSIHRFGETYGLGMSPEQAFELWSDSYEIVLREHSNSGDWIFVHYDQIAGGAALPTLSEALGIELDPSFADASRQSSQGPVESGPRALGIYDELCSRANYPGPDQRSSRAVRWPRLARSRLSPQGV